MDNLTDNRILGYYRVTYASNGFVQDKQLVSREDWYDIIKPVKKAIEIIEDDNKGKQNEQSKLLRSSLRLMFGDCDICFPIGCPLHESMQTGFISLPPAQGGNHKVSWKQIIYSND